MTSCSFPNCHNPVIGANRSGQAVCRDHLAVVIGIYVPDQHDAGEAVQD